MERRDFIKGAAAAGALAMIPLAEANSLDRGECGECLGEDRIELPVVIQYIQYEHEGYFNDIEVTREPNGGYSTHIYNGKTDRFRAWSYGGGDVLLEYAYEEGVLTKESKYESKTAFLG